MIAMRINPEVFDKLSRSAAARKIPIAQDAANRIEQSFAFDQSEEGIKKLLADFDQTLAEGRDAAMRQWGLLPVGGRDGLWVESDKIKPQEMVALNPALETLIERVVMRTLEKARQS